MEYPRLCRNHLTDQNFGLCITPKDLILPYLNSPGINYYRPWQWCMDSDIKDFGSTIDNQREKFKITLDVQHFRPQEINVKVNDKEVVIEGKHEEKEDNHGFISRQFKRRYLLPSDCPPENISSTLSSDGILTIIANKTLSKDLKDIEIKVPIQMCGTCPMKLQMEKKQVIKTEKEEQANEANKTQVEDIINNNVDILNSKTNFILNDDKHCTIKPDITMNTASSTTDQILKEAKKETDNLLRMTTEMTGSDTLSSMGKLDKIMEQSKITISDLTEKISEKSTANISESNFKSTIKETMESEEISSFKSSMKACMKMSGEQRSEFVSDVISAELREAADNI